VLRKLNDVAKTVASVVRVIFDVRPFFVFSSYPLTLLQRVQNIPGEYDRVRELTLGVADDLETSIEAGKGKRVGEEEGLRKKEKG
jgi:endonuclease III-like uncharacterized protein